MKASALDREGDYIFVGKFDLGRDVVGLLAKCGEDPSGHVVMSFADNSTPGQKAYHSKVEGLNYIVVGLNHPTWARCLGTLLHETMELVMMQLQCRYSNAESFSRSHAGYWFWFTHEQYTDMIERVGIFIARSQCALAALHRKRKKLKLV